MDGTQPVGNNQEEAAWQFKPGETVTPQQPAPAETAAPKVDAKKPDPAPADTQAPATSPQTAAVEPKSVAVPPSGSQGQITWMASEFLDHSKTAAWYGLLALGAIVLAAIVWLLTKDKISTTVVLVAALAFGYYATRQPRDLTYKLDGDGLSIGSKNYAYGSFRSFAVVEDNGFTSLVFLPLKRFAPLLTVYFDPQDGRKIMDLLNDRLPMEAYTPDLLDRLMAKIRF